MSVSEDTTRRPGETDDNVAMSVVIPAYNELLRLPPTLRTISKYLADHYPTWELIVSDDGSTDGSVDQLQPQFPAVRFLRAPANAGKGAAVRRGMLVARGLRVLFSDADLSTPIIELGPMEKAMLDGGYDIAIASRDLRESKLEIRQPWYRELAGKVFNMLVRNLSGLHYMDTQCGFKLFSATSAKTIFYRAKSDRFAFDVELLLIAKRQKLKVLEHPVHWINAEGSKVNFLRDGPRMVMDIIRFRLRGIGK